MLLPISGLSARSAARVSTLTRGFRMMSHTSTWW